MQIIQDSTFMIDWQAVERSGFHRASVGELLISTKLRIPSLRSKRVARPELITFLDDSVTRKLTLVNTPAGYGATTLLSDWAEQTSLSTAWLELEEQDNQPERFWVYFITSLQSLHETLGETALALLHAQDTYPIEHILTSLINDISLLPEVIVLILDNYHLISTPAIHSTMGFLLDHLPAQLHIMMASRTTPPLPLARLRGMGQLTELFANNLRFTYREIEALTNQIYNFGMSPAELQLLEERTEGWITGLQLIALSQHGHHEKNLSSLNGSHRYIVDYFSEEIFDKQSQSTQDFLLYTSMLDSFNAELSRAVSDQPDSRNMLDMLERENVFLVALDEARQKYRYHRLFGEFLRSRLHIRIPEYPTHLHLRAAEWYRTNGFAGEAVSHSLAAQDYEQAAQLAEQSAEEMWMRGQIVTLLRWLVALPDELLRTRAKLCLFHAWALFFSENQLYAAEGRVQDAERVLASANTADIAYNEAELRGMIATIRAAFAVRREEIEQGIELSNQALAMLPENRIQWRSAALLSLAISYVTAGNVVAASHALVECQTFSQMSGHHLNDVIATYNQGRLQILQGHLQQAAIFFRQVIELSDQYQLQLPMAGTAKIGLGYLLYEWNHLTTATSTLTEGIELCKALGNIEAPLRAYIILAQISRARQDAESAMGFMQMAEHLAHRANRPSFINWVEASQARLYLAQGNAEAAVRWGKRNTLDPNTLTSYIYESVYLNLSRIWIVHGKSQETEAILKLLLDEAEIKGRDKSVIEILILQALALQEQGDIETGIAILKRALALAEPGGFVRLFADEGKPMSILLRHAASRGIAPHYVSRLLAAFDDSPHTILSHHQPLIDPLSDRELEVLQLITQGLSNHQIATELFVAISTVKTHVKSIYRKLNVTGRFEAIERVRDLSLLPIEDKTATTANGKT
jgi:LuxR family maltose regulon positive regulatory protein